MMHQEVVKEQVKGLTWSVTDKLVKWKKLAEKQEIRNQDRSLANEVTVMLGEIRSRLETLDRYLELE